MAILPSLVNPMKDYEGKTSAFCSRLGCDAYEWASVLRLFDTDIKSLSAQTTGETKPPTLY